MSDVKNYEWKINIELSGPSFGAIRPIDVRRKVKEMLTGDGNIIFIEDPKTGDDLEFDIRVSTSE
jgi:hypothetical protein